MKTTSMLILVLVTLCATASAQQRESYAQSVAVNPVFLPFGTASAEFERTLSSPHLTAGLSAWYEFKDVKARWVYAKCMYYPGSNALEGFSFGPTLGYIIGYRKDDQPEKRADESSLMAGGMAQYNILLGSNDNILIGVGAGVRAPLKKLDDASPLSRVDGEARLVLGIVF